MNPLCSLNPLHSLRSCTATAEPLAMAVANIISIIPIAVLILNLIIITRLDG